MRHLSQRQTLAIGFVVGMVTGFFLFSPQTEKLVKLQRIVTAKVRRRIEVPWVQIARYCAVTSRDWPGPLVHVPAIHPEKIEERSTCPVLWQTPMGQYWGRRSEKPVLKGLFTEQYLERSHDYARPQCTILRQDVVVDAGAHLGTFTRFALDRGAGKVIAYEPDPTNATCFRRTFASEIANGRVVLLEAALWDAPGTMRLSVAPESWRDSVAWDFGGDSVEVPTVTMDDSLAKLGIEHVDFLKMDIEGAERHALIGAARIVKQSSPRMALAIEHAKDDLRVIGGWVKEMNQHYVMEPGTDLLYCHL